MSDDKKPGLSVAEGGNKPSINLPAVLDVVSPEGSKVCPFMAPAVTPYMIDVSQRSGLALAGRSQADQVPVFVRNFSPCVGAQCMAWREGKFYGEGDDRNTDGGCRLVEK